jgi:NADH-quinone oxidoreductase subunit N
MRDLFLALPELFVLTMTCVVLIADVFRGDGKATLAYKLAQVTLALTIPLVLLTYSSEPVLAFFGTYVNDPMASVLKCMVLLVTLGVFVYSREYLGTRQLLSGEYFVLGLFAVLGMMVMISAHNFLTVYLGLELLSLSLYAMVAMHKDSGVASEAAMKYFVLGAIASGMLLYGISIIYGVTGSLDLATVAQALSAHAKANLLLIFGLVFIVAGLAFKLGVVPFHMWIPDVYHGAPTSVTLFIGTAPKLSAFAIAFRMLVDGLPGLVDHWQGMLIFLAVMSMATGNIIAIAQTNLKRMLAYSTIAHMGFLLLGLLAGTKSGYAGSMFYVITYAIMGLGSFGMIILLGRAGFEADKLDDFKGLAVRSPWFALMMLMIIFSLAGVPPFVGFWAKWFVIKEAVNAGFTTLAVTAVIFSIIGAYYYLRVVKLMYFDKAEATDAIVCGRQMQWVMSANGLAVLVLGLVPGLLMSVCVAAIVA